MNKKEKILIGMNEIMLSLNNEDMVMPWLIGGVPDGAEEEEIMEMANDPEDFAYCASLFLDIIRDKEAWDDGLYIDDMLITADSRNEEEDE